MCLSIMSTIDKHMPLYVTTTLNCGSIMETEVISKIPLKFLLNNQYCSPKVD